MFVNHQALGYPLKLASFHQVQHAADQSDIPTEQGQKPESAEQRRRKPLRNHTTSQ